MWVDSNEVTIVNLPPTAPTVRIEPNAVFNGTVICSSKDVLICRAFDSSDPERGALSYEYRWMRNALDTGISTQQVPLGTLNVGEIWSCMARAKDDVGNVSAWVESASVTVTDVPSAPAVVLANPLAASGSAELVCTITTPSVDPLGGSVSYVYAWVKNMAFVPGLTAATIPSSLLVVGDVWACSVYAVTPRGFQSASVTSNEIKIGN